MSKCDLQSNFIEIILRHGCSPVNLLHIFRTPGGMLLKILMQSNFVKLCQCQILQFFRVILCRDLQMKAGILLAQIWVTRFRWELFQKA